MTGFSMSGRFREGIGTTLSGRLPPPSALQIFRL